MGLLGPLRQRKEWMFFAALPKADARLAFTWWAVVLLHGILPALFAIAMGVLVGAVQRGESLAGPLGLVGVVEPNGECGDVRIVRTFAPPYGLDRQALDAARRWRFRPGTWRGEPVPVLVSLEIEFNIH